MLGRLLPGAGRRRLVVWAGVCTGLLGLFLGLRFSTGEPSPKAAGQLLRVQALSPVRYQVATSLQKGESLHQLFARLGLPEPEKWVAATASLVDARRLPAGLPVVEERLWGAQVVALRLLFPFHEILLEEANGQPRASRRQRTVRQLCLVRSGHIRSSLFAAVREVGEEDELAVALAQVFAWQVDFHRDLQPQDTFQVVFVGYQVDGERAGLGPILAASLSNKGKTYRAFRFVTQGKAGYFDEAGRPLKRQFLRSPLPYTRVTSRFSLSRLHPILGRRLPHFGVDYAAPPGTPVQATADGIVSFRGYRGGGGNTVEIRHPGGYVTAYLHLSRFAPGLSPGSRVSQGQVIGYVGATGLATGPHLDYRVSHLGRYVNPALLGGDPLPPLQGEELARFSQVRQALERIMVGHSQLDAIDLDQDSLGVPGAAFLVREVEAGAR